MTTNESLLQMIKSKDTQIATLVDQVKELNASVIELTKEVGKAVKGRPERPERERRTYPKEGEPGFDATWNQRRNDGRYCHTHGFNSKEGCTSKDCKNPGPKHNSEATINDRRGGCKKGPRPMNFKW